MITTLARRILSIASIAFLTTGSNASAAADEQTYTPAFEFEKWQYQSYLVLPTSQESKADAGTPVTANKWAKGNLTLSDSPDGYAAAGFLDFPARGGLPGVRLNVSVSGAPGKGDTPATFEAIGVSRDGPTKGAEYQLVGWVFRDDNGKVKSVAGSVRAVHGPHARPDFELGGMPVGTVGAFEITRRK